VAALGSRCERRPPLPPPPAGLPLSSWPIKADGRLWFLAATAWHYVSAPEAWQLGHAQQLQRSSSALAALVAFSQQARVLASLEAFLRGAGQPCKVAGPLLACALAADGPTAQFLCSNMGCVGRCGWQCVEAFVVGPGVAAAGGLRQGGHRPSPT
jgi:hypothetical protein